MDDDMKTMKRARWLYTTAHSPLSFRAWARMVYIGYPPSQLSPKLLHIVRGPGAQQRGKVV